MSNIGGAWPPSGQPGTSNFYRLPPPPPLTLALITHFQVGVHSSFAWSTIHKRRRTAFRISFPMVSNFSNTTRALSDICQACFRKEALVNPFWSGPFVWAVTPTDVARQRNVVIFKGRYVGYRLPIDTASHTRRTECSATPLRQPQSLQRLV